MARYLASTDLTGFDPFAGLLSPAARLLPRGLPQQVWLRATAARGGLGLRLSGVPRIRMAKTIALVLLAQAVHPSPSLRTPLLMQDLEHKRSTDGGWGYEFDAQLRWGRYSAGASNAIATAFATEARTSPTGIEDPVLLRYLMRDLRDPRGFFRYSAGNPVLIYNANALISRTVARLGGPRETVLSSIDWTLKARNASGIWGYGDGQNLGWADSYHNAYITWVLQDLADMGFVSHDVVDESTDLWLRLFFDSTGFAKLLVSDHEPTHDINAVATALYWLCTIKRPNGLIESRIQATARQLLSWQRADGSVGVGSGRFPRWGDAPSLLGLAALVKWLERSKADTAAPAVIDT
ncbi:hypothetical protein ACQ86B_21780 [Mycolicibacterium aichiense]|uniref:hypothetical protein n=1 Tax=Mycolicibacterium aichiense TaxID=1799 RepID=UPI003D66E40F